MSEYIEMKIYEIWRLFCRDRSPQWLCMWCLWNDGKIGNYRSARMAILQRKEHPSEVREIGNDCSVQVAVGIGAPVNFGLTLLLDFSEILGRIFLESVVFFSVSLVYLRH